MPLAGSGLSYTGKLPWMGERAGLLDLVGESAMENLAGPFIGLGERVGLVDEGTSREIRNRYDATVASYLGEDPSGGRQALRWTAEFAPDIALALATIGAGPAISGALRGPSAVMKGARGARAALSPGVQTALSGLTGAAIGVGHVTEEDSVGADLLAGGLGGVLGAGGKALSGRLASKAGKRAALLAEVEASPGMSAAAVPWEMTATEHALRRTTAGMGERELAEVAIGRVQRDALIEGTEGAALGKPKRWQLTQKEAYVSGQSIEDHAKSVKKAFDKGKDVPHEVLADYPELAERAASERGMFIPPHTVLDKQREFKQRVHDLASGQALKDERQSWYEKAVAAGIPLSKAAQEELKREFPNVVIAPPRGIINYLADPGFMMYLHSKGQTPVVGSLARKWLGEEGALPRIRDSLQKFFSSSGEFRAMGFMARDAAEGRRIADAGVRAIELQSGKISREYSLQVRRILKEAEKRGTDLTEADIHSWGLDQIESALPDMRRFPTLEKTLRKMRGDVDALTTAIIHEEGSAGIRPMVGSKLKRRLGQNLGKYIRRTFKIHQEPDEWRRFMFSSDPSAKALWDDLEKLAAKEMPEWSPAEVKAWGNHMLTKEGDEFFSYKSGTGTTPRDIFKRKKDLPDEIVAFLGEYKNPAVRYMNSVSRMTYNLNYHRYQADLYRAGAGKVFFRSRKEAVQSGLTNVKKFRGGMNRNPLSGKWASADVVDAIHGAENPTRAGGIMGTIGMLNFLTRTGKTVFSPMTHARNTIAWGAMLSMNGHFLKAAVNPASWGRSIAAIASATAAESGIVGRATSRAVKFGSGMFGSIESITGSNLGRVTTEELATFYGEMQRRGVTSGVGHASELLSQLQRAEGTWSMTMAKDLGGRLGKAKGVTGRALRGAKAALIDTPQKLYGWEDELGKLGSAMAEYSNYKVALKGTHTDEQILDKVADIVRRTTPSYDMANKATKALRDFPLVGDFPTFYAEIIRSTKEVVKQSFAEMGDLNPAVRAIGRKRLGGAMATTMVSPVVAAAGAHAIFGTTEEDVNFVREMGPPWFKNADLIVRKMEDGSYQTTDLSFMMPYEILRNPVRAMVLNKGGWDERLWDSTLEASQPFLDAGIMSSTVQQMVEGETEFGGTIRLTGDTRANAIRDTIDYGWRKMQPGAFATWRKIGLGLQGKEDPVNGRTYNADEELAALGGLRVVKSVPSRQMEFAANDFQKARNQTMIRWNKDKGRLGYTIQEKMERQARYNEAFSGSFDLMLRKVEAARGAELSDSQINHSMKNAGVGKEWRLRLLRGSYRELITGQRLDR